MSQCILRQDMYFALGDSLTCFNTINNSSQRSLISARYPFLASQYFDFNRMVALSISVS